MPAWSQQDDLRARLFQDSILHPTDVRRAIAYARACEAVGDAEGAIGALERGLIYADNPAPLEAELGKLYHSLGSNVLARHYVDKALADPRLDSETRTALSQLETAAAGEPPAKSITASLQTGVRFQSNAALNSDNNVLRIASQDFILAHPGQSGSDANSFQTVQVGYAHQFDARGDTLEATLAGYDTQQFRFSDLNVGFYDISVGPRLAMAPELLPNWMVKPYLVGGQVFLAGARYLTSGGGGLVATLPVLNGYQVEPGIEVRRAYLSDPSVYSSLSSGDTTTLSLSVQKDLSGCINANARLLFSRNGGGPSYQSFNTVTEEFALITRFSAPFNIVATKWSASPYIRLSQMAYDAANPFIDAATIRRDQELETGLVLDTAFTDRISITTNLQYANDFSNIPNYRLKNISILSGPMVRY